MSPLNVLTKLFSLEKSSLEKQYVISGSWNVNKGIFKYSKSILVTNKCLALLLLNNNGHYFDVQKFCDDFLQLPTYIPIQLLCFKNSTNLIIILPYLLFLTPGNCF